MWAGLRSAIPPSLRTKEDEVKHLDTLGFYYNKMFFDVTLAKSREYYKFLIQLKATLPKSASKLQDKCDIDSISLPNIYLLSRTVCLESYLRDFQFKLLNYITCTNILFKKMGKVDSDLCSLCNTESEYIEHLFYHCPFSLLFWRDFEVFWSINTNEAINLPVQDIIVGIFNEDCEFLNYCILVGKSTTFQCRRNNIKPSIQLFKVYLNPKNFMELVIAQKNNGLDTIKKKWKFKPLT